MFAALTVHLGGAILGILGSAIAIVAIGADPESPPRRQLIVIVASLALQWAGWSAGAVHLSRRYGSGHPLSDLRARWRPIDVVVGTAAALVTTFILVPLLYVALLSIGVIDQRSLTKVDDPAQDLSAAARGPSFALLVLLVGIGAPLMEEVVFRGLLQTAAVRRFGALPGVIGVAAFFGLSHLQLLQFPALALFGLVLGTLVYRTRRLGPAVVAHVVFNCFTLARLWIDR